jgi:hypothetical protein
LRKKEKGHVRRTRPPCSPRRERDPIRDYERKRSNMFCVLELAMDSD